MEGVLMDTMYNIPSDDSIEECIITKDVVEEDREPVLVHKGENRKKLDTAI